MPITTRTQINDDDDDAFDHRGILRDGARVSVGMLVRDSNDAWRDTMHGHLSKDGVARRFGLADGLELNRPGYRHVTDAAALDAVEQAYRDYDAAECERWKTCGDATREFRGQQPGDQCTINGAPGHLNSNLECIPDLQDIAEDALAREYALYDQEMANAWRNPR